jgi:hypothetical protein
MIYSGITQRVRFVGGRFGTPCPFQIPGRKIYFQPEDGT